MHFRLLRAIFILSLLVCSCAHADLKFSQSRDTPLQNAILKNSLTDVLTLLRSGADPSARNSANLNALHVATTYCETSVLIVRAVIETAPSLLDAPDPNGQTPLLLAARSACLDQINYLLSVHADVKARSLIGNTVLHSLYLNDYWVDPTLLKILGTARADFHAVNQQGKLPLHLAASKLQEPDTVSELIRSGESPEAEDLTGKTALFYVMSQVAAEELIAAGGKVQHADHEGSTPLHVIAVRYGEANTPEIMQAFIASGADVNARNHRARTPLLELADSFPASHGNASLLIKKGADVNARDADGLSPLDLALARHNGLAEILKQGGRHLLVKNCVK